MPGNQPDRAYPVDDGSCEQRQRDGEGRVERVRAREEGEAPPLGLHQVPHVEEKACTDEGGREQNGHHEIEPQVLEHLPSPQHPAGSGGGRLLRARFPGQMRVFVRRKQPGDGGDQYDGGEDRHHQPDLPPGEPRGHSHRRERHERLTRRPAHRDDAHGAAPLGGEMPPDARH